MKRINLKSGAPWEEKIGYSRAVRIEDHIEVTGTVAFKEGKIVGPGDAYVQAKCILDIIEDQLMQLGATLDDVIRTRIFVTNMDDWKEIGRAHSERFGHNPPATSMVEVSALIAEDFLVEIEATAVCS